MKLITIIVKDTVTGTISKFNVKAKPNEKGTHIGLMNGTYISLDYLNDTSYDKHAFDSLNKSDE